MSAVPAVAPDFAASAGLGDVGAIGNGQITALVRADGDIPWCCWPRPDGDPVFCSLLAKDQGGTGRGAYSISLIGQTRSSLHYLRNTAILQSTAHDERGNAVRITSWCPRHVQQGRVHRPAMLVRRVEPAAGRPTIRIRVQPVSSCGQRPFLRQLGTDCVRFIDSSRALRLTTDGSVSYLAEERVFVLDRPIHLVLGEDDALTSSAQDTAAATFEATERYWLGWVQGLSIPFEWQEAVIRAAISLQLATFEDTGAVIAAPTTSIPDCARAGGTWDYRYCWLRDAHTIVQALNRLGLIGPVESFLRFLDDVVLRDSESLLQPVYGLSGERDLSERHAPALDGMHGLGPVRIGNSSHALRQHDVYGSIILACAQSFHDQRLRRCGDRALFESLQRLGERSSPLAGRADAGIWEQRDRLRAHTSSAAMCWAGCDRLARIAARLGLEDRRRYWRKRADSLGTQIRCRSWRSREGWYSAALDEDVVDASVLLLPELGLVKGDDARFLQTLRVIEPQLRQGEFVRRLPEVSSPAAGSEHPYVACSFWLANALAGAGRHDEARGVFESVLRARNSVGLLAERIDAHTGALWGNFPHTASMAGLIATASRLSERWEEGL